MYRMMVKSKGTQRPSHYTFRRERGAKTCAFERTRVNFNVFLGVSPKSLWVLLYGQNEIRFLTKPDGGLGSENISKIIGLWPILTSFRLHSNQSWSNFDNFFDPSINLVVFHRSTAFPTAKNGSICANLRKFRHFGANFAWNPGNIKGFWPFSVKFWPIFTSHGPLFGAIISTNFQFRVLRMASK